MFTKVSIKFLPTVEQYIKLQCNSDKSLYTNFPEVKYADEYLENLLPKNVLEIGAGVGRASVYLFKNYKWTNTQFNLLDGDRGNVSFDGLRNKDKEFYNSLEISNIFCRSNGLSNVNQFDADNDDWLSNLKNIDLVYSFLAIGFHWPIDFYLDKIYDILVSEALVIFGIRDVEKIEWIIKQLNVVNNKKYELMRLVCTSRNERSSLLILKRK